MASGEFWNDTQAKFPEDITINPYLLTTDSTHLTNFSGDKKVKPLLLASGHMQKKIRAKPSSHAWLPCGMLPEGKFPKLEFKSSEKAKLLPGILAR
ncbi:hypothetical protein BU17DRAFT_48437 [Hysterangium stoloniferum]|nr:hypothetical protein BU17DRAFT_48437 [Hysterangium stoloniferum]